MKTSKYLKTIAFCALMLAAAMPGKAQVFPNTYINIDWQVGVPLGAGFADKASGWGMNFEGGYFVTPAITVGPFISYQTNLQSISRQTLDLGNGSALTTNQKHALFQLPFGVTGRYNWLTDSVFQPYAGLKLGANYAEMSSYYYIIKQYTDTRLPAGVPRSALFQLLDQQRRRADLLDEQHQQFRYPRRYLLLTPVG